jgi:hypothetical protein
MDVGIGCGLLASLNHEAAFRENAVNEAILPKLTPEEPPK